MAGDWIKWVKGLPEKPEVARMAAMLQIDRDHVAGLLMRFWSWCDDNIPQEGLEENGSAVIGLSPLDGDNLTSFIDQVTGRQGFSRAMIQVGWLIARASIIELPNFERHNLATAKTRSRNSLNQALRRKCKQAQDTPETPTVQENASFEPKNGVSPSRGDKKATREEKRREERNTNTPLPPKGDLVFDLPENLRTEKFQAAWEKWLQHRRETRHPLKPTTRTAQLAKLSAWGPEKAVGAIEQSIVHGWQGLFEPAVESAQNGKPPVRREETQAEQLARLRREGSL